MDRFELMALKALLPGAAWLLMATLAITLLSGLNSNPHTAVLLDTLSWGPAAMFAWGCLQLAHATYRLRQWQRGEGALCECGGLLGRERDGRYGLYRKCLACNRNRSCRHH